MLAFLRTLIRLSLGLVVLVLLAALVLYVIACAVPGDYQPLELSQDERQQVVDAFYARLLDFGNGAEDVHPFSLRLTERELNEYLSSMDAIVQKLPDRKEGEATAALAEAGVSSPAVAIRDGAIRLMARSEQYDKIVSLDLAMELRDGSLHVRTAGARVGRLPIPKLLVRRLIEALKQRLPAPDPQAAENPVRGREAEEVGVLFETILRSLDDRPIRAVGGFRKDRQVELTGLTISPGQIELQFVPYGRRTISPSLANP